MVVSCDTVDGRVASIIEKAKVVCIAINSLRKGDPVEVKTAT
jgi:hypothetical protein